MKRNIVIEEERAIPPYLRETQIVERKGKGHPDTIADSIAEEFSRNLCRAYIKKTGFVLHHNVDKLDVVGGVSRPKFGGGEIIKPIMIFFSGRATDQLGSTKFDIEKIAIDSAKSWIKNNLRYLDPDKHVRYQVETKPGAAALADLLKRKAKIPLANDTSIGIGYAPLTETERLVLSTEAYLNSKKFKQLYPNSGEDVKVMALRIKDRIDLTVGMAMIDRGLDSISDYLALKAEIIDEIKKYASSLTQKKVRVWLNSADQPKRGVNGCYLTVTGLSAECGDDGAVGRGNRIHGLITPDRPMIMEAAAGKNPINHVGKIYNVLACRIADRIIAEVSEVDDVIVRLLSRIGTPIDQPQIASIRIRSNTKYPKAKVNAIVNDEFEGILKLQKELIKGKYKFF